jgi:hypothetical protein
VKGGGGNERVRPCLGFYLAEVSSRWNGSGRGGVRAYSLAIGGLGGVATLSMIRLGAWRLEGGVNKLDI